MSSVCMSSCVNDTQYLAPNSRVQRGTYVSLHRWPESDAQFVRSLGLRSTSSGSRPMGPRVVDSISCRQVYLRSYTFTRKESVNERTFKCFGKVKDKVVNANNNKNKKRDRKYCAALKSLFRKLLLCSATTS